MFREGERFHILPDESRIPKDKKDFVMTEINKLADTLAEIFPLPCKYGVCKPGEYSGLTVIDRLIDTEETRIGPPPEGEARRQIEKQADIAVGKKSPVVLVGIYGTPRHLDHPELNSAQLADMASVMMVQAALDRVHSAHLAGAQYRMVDEDLTALWLDIAQHPSGKSGTDHFKSIYEKYINDRLRLLCTLEKEGLINTGATRIQLLSESKLYKSTLKNSTKDHTLHEEDFFTKCEKNRHEFLCYLVVSGNIIKKYYGSDDQNWISSDEDQNRWEKCKKEIQETAEYSAIKLIGWQGLIPPEMRKYYLEKY